MIRQLRLWSGLVFALFVALHLCNLALGLVSFDAMEAMRLWLDPIWSSLPGQILLYGSLLTHLSLALWGLYARQTLRMRPWEALQILLGLAIPPLLLGHIVGTRVLDQLYGLSPDYATVLSALWGDPVLAVRQAVVLLLVWVHLLIGLHFWLRLRAGYRTALPLLYPLSVLIPTLALLAYVHLGLSLPELSLRPDWRATWQTRFDALSEAQIGIIQSIVPWGYAVLAVSLLAVLSARLLRRTYRQRFGGSRMKLANGGQVAVPRGWSVLESLRAAGIPHASVCGGRGRCTTCRIRIDSGGEGLPLPNDTERKALERIGVPAGVRLACQLRPGGDLAVTPLLPASAGVRSLRQRGAVEGRECQVAVLFADLRGSTRLAEQLLPFDVVFILNQFFAELSAALHATGGHYAQFNGDGLMALYGLENGLDNGCRQAILGAADMQRRLNVLNTRLEQDLGQNLRMGVGIHSGEAIVGRMGPPDAPSLTALGDTVNVAARLEGLCKVYQCPLVISQVTADRAGIDCSVFQNHRADVKGRDGGIQVVSISDPSSIRIRDSGLCV